MSIGMRPENAEGLVLWPKLYDEFTPWPTEPKIKGKPILVNDTFVRVDDVTAYTVYARYGERHPIVVASSMGDKGLAMNACQGHVLAPNHDLSNASQPGTNKFTASLRSRCMTETELIEARKDHIFARTLSSPWTEKREVSVEVLNVPGKENAHSLQDGDLRLRAFNKALHKRRQEIAAKMAERGLKWDYDKFFTSSYDDVKMSDLFRRKVPPPPSELKTGRENAS